MPRRPVRGETYSQAKLHGFRYADRWVLTELKSESRSGNQCELTIDYRTLCYRNMVVTQGAVNRTNAGNLERHTRPNSNGYSLEIAELKAIAFVVLANTKSPLSILVTD